MTTPVSVWGGLQRPRGEAGLASLKDESSRGGEGPEGRLEVGACGAPGG